MKNVIAGCYRTIFGRSTGRHHLQRFQESRRQRGLNILRATNPTLPIAMHNPNR
jgi:hypothetical protein